MKGTTSWSYHPYRPPLSDVGDIYICRTVPYADKIHFEWLDIGADEYSVFYKRREDEGFTYFGETKKTECDINNLSCETDYEFYVSAGEKRSRTRLARCGESVGTAVNYLHPDDEAYAFSGRYLCSPSLIRHPDGYLLASMDLYAAGHPQNLTLIFRSDDEGVSWHYVSELMPCFWGKMFIHNGEIYMLSCSTEYGDLLIGKSTDGAKTFSMPVCLLRGSNGKGGNCGIHKNPQNVLRHNGRIYVSLEWGAWSNEDFRHAAMVMSCDESADLLNPESWSFTEPRKFDYFDTALIDLPKNAMTIEGTLALTPDGRLLDIMRFEKFGHVIAYEMNQENPEEMLRYSHLIKFPANFSKFMIKRDDVTGVYYSLATRLYDDNPIARNLLSLMRSDDLESWSVACDVYDYRGEDSRLIGFQYVDFEFDGDDIIFLCRTAINGAHTFHDTNYSTFDRIKNFRDIHG